MRPSAEPRLASRGRALVGALAFGLWTASLVPLQMVLRLLPGNARRLLPLVYHRGTCWIAGLRVRVTGAALVREPALVVCNHISYMDISVLGAVIPGHFVAKREVASWPLFGVLAKLSDSVFVERDRRRTGDARGEMEQRLDDGGRLILFPEGTSSDGSHVLPFRSSLFAVAAHRSRPGGDGTGEARREMLRVQPVSIAYTRLDGVPLGRGLRPLVAWYGDMTLAPHLWRLLGLGQIDVSVHVHPAVTLADFANRKALARYCERCVAESVARANAGRLDVDDPHPALTPVGGVLLSPQVDEWAPPRPS